MSALLAPGLPDQTATGRSGPTLSVVTPEGNPVAMSVLPQRPGIADPDRRAGSGVELEVGAAMRPAGTLQPED